MPFYPRLVLSSLDALSFMGKSLVNMYNHIKLHYSNFDDNINTVVSWVSAHGCLITQDIVSTHLYRSYYIDHLK